MGGDDPAMMMMMQQQQQQADPRTNGDIISWSTADTAQTKSHRYGKRYFGGGYGGGQAPYGTDYVGQPLGVAA